ncbi:MAG: hypothetical protein V5A64_04185 [Candidatus Thermoplasmatota archaeon]
MRKEDVIPEEDISKEKKEPDIEGKLDKNFKKAELAKRKRKEGTKERKKPFLRSGVLLVMVAVVCLVLTYLGPWTYISCDSYTQNETVEAVFYRNDEIDNAEEEIKGVFEFGSENENQYSSTPIGLSFQDFSSTSKILIYGFSILLLLSLIFIGIQLIDRFFDLLSKENFKIFHSIFSAVIVTIGVFLLISLIKFLGVYHLIYYNQNLVSTGNIRLIFPTAFLVILILSITIKVAFSIMSINIKELHKKWRNEERKDNLLSYYKM